MSQYFKLFHIVFSDVADLLFFTWNFMNVIRCEKSPVILKIIRLNTSGTD